MTREVVSNLLISECCSESSIYLPGVQAPWLAAKTRCSRVLNFISNKGGDTQSGSVNPG
jgi:hypothetical protein